MPDAPLGRLTLLAPVPAPTTNFAPVWLAAGLGYAAEEGLDLRIEIAGSPKEAADGVIAGHGDLTFINVVFTLLARDRGVPFCPFYAFVRAQNRAFSVPVASPIRDIAGLRGKTIGLHYDDPELFDFACAVLRGSGIDPTRDVAFKTLPGTPLDAPRMADAIRGNEVDAIWQLDVFAGFMAAEGVPLRLLPAPMIDRLTPSSCFNAMDATLAAKPEALGAFGRAVAKATLFALGNPERAVRTMWRCFPDAAPPPGTDAGQAFRRERAALDVRLAGHRIDSAPIPLWGAISAPEIAAWQDFLLATGAIHTRRAPEVYFSDALVGAFNDFDPAPVLAAAPGET
ncbi:MAG: ABC transporter substrate-binding protein [Acetobacteraceae bacterium]